MWAKIALKRVIIKTHCIYLPIFSKNLHKPLFLSYKHWTCWQKFRFPQSIVGQCETKIILLYDNN